MPQSQAILSPWKRPQSSAVVTDLNPMFMAKPNCHFPEQSLTKPPALARPFFNRDPPVFNLKKDSGRACHLTSLMILLLWLKLRVDRAFWMSWAQDLISATTWSCNNNELWCVIITNNFTYWLYYKYCLLVNPRDKHAVWNILFLFHLILSFL